MLENITSRVMKEDSTVSKHLMHGTTQCCRISCRRALTGCYGQLQTPPNRIEAQRFLPSFQTSIIGLCAGLELTYSIQAFSNSLEAFVNGIEALVHHFFDVVKASRALVLEAVRYHRVSRSGAPLSS